MRFLIALLALAALLAAVPAHAQLMDAEKDRVYRSLLPKIDDKEIMEQFRDSRLLLYTADEVPLARQIWNTVSGGVHSPLYDISGGADHIGRGSSFEFPWKEPAGTDHIPASTLVKFRAMWLPLDKDGNPYPIVWWREPQRVPRNAQNPGKSKFEWMYPNGTRFYEVLARRLSNGKVVTFEVRMRQREGHEWGVDVFRPYPTWRDMQKKLIELGERERAAALDRPRLYEAALADTFHPHKQSIREKGVSEQLETYPDALVEKLLVGAEFYSSIGETWRDLPKGPDVVAPAGGVNPKDYLAIMEVDRVSCARCHEHTNVSVDFFHLGRDWYGNVPGSDRIFTMHIFDPSCISRNGYNPPVVLRREFVAWGILERYDPRVHGSMYTPLKD